MVKELERVARRPKGHRHCHPERTYAAVRRRSSHARELVGPAYAGMGRARYDKPVRAAGMRETCRREQLSAAATTATIDPPSDGPFAPAQDTLPCNTANSRSPAVRRNRTDISEIENMAATAKAVNMAEAAEMAAEGAAIVEAEGIKIATGAAVSKIEVARISDSAKRSLAPTAISV